MRARRLVLIATLPFFLAACMAPLVPPEDRAATCTVAPVADICLTGRAWPWDQRRSAAHQLSIQLAEQAAEKERAQQEAAAQQAAAQAQFDAQQKKTEEKREAPRYVNREKTRFVSFEDALAALPPEVDLDRALLTNPMEFKGRITAARAQIVQVVDGGLLLLNPCRDMGDVCLAVGRISDRTGGPKEFVDDQVIEFVGEIVGTYQYQAVTGVAKTVPSVRLYGIRSGR